MSNTVIVKRGRLRESERWDSRSARSPAGTPRTELFSQLHANIHAKKKKTVRITSTPLTLAKQRLIPRSWPVAAPLRSTEERSSQGHSSTGRRVRGRRSRASIAPVNSFAGWYARSAIASRRRRDSRRKNRIGRRGRQKRKPASGTKGGSENRRIGCRVRR